MAESSLQKWPVEFKIVKMSDSMLSSELNLFFVSGKMNIEQCNTLKSSGLVVHSEYLYGSDQVLISTLVSEIQLRKVHQHFKPLSKSWRGQYLALAARTFVNACEEALK